MEPIVVYHSTTTTTTATNDLCRCRCLFIWPTPKQSHTLTTVQRLNTFGMGLAASAVGIYARSIFDAPPEIEYPPRSKNFVINMGKVRGLRFHSSQRLAVSPVCNFTNLHIPPPSNPSI